VTSPAGRPGVNQSINTVLNRIAIRAESSTPEYLYRTFVSLEQIATGLLRIDNQVMYGRRGTGKTHHLANLASEVSGKGDIAVYIDLRKIGSNNGLYADASQPMELRATQLLIDIVEALHIQLLTVSVEDERFEAMYPYLDAIGDTATQIRVEGGISVVEEEELLNSEDDSRERRAELKLPRIDARAGTGRSRRSSKTNRVKTQVKRSGPELPHILFGPLGRSLEDAASSISPHRIWILFDEWSGIPIDLQPLVADMLRRAIFPARGYTVKIAAIERRSRFIKRTDASNYIGLELGSDTAAALDLDEYLLEAEAGPSAQDFFARLLFSHLKVLAEDLEVDIKSLDPSVFISTAFEERAFAELVRAAEGVPRDALNIAGAAAISARSEKIRVSDIKAAARKYYLHDKETGISGNTPAQNMWRRLQSEVVAGRRSRTFMLRRERENTNQSILDLYDARLIHLLRPGLARPNSPGVEYDGYSVDYGSYVHLMDEAHADAMWDARSRPWEYNRDDVFLPDKFDESVIFIPDRIKASKDVRSRK
jgi:hypothetical protein